MAIAPYVSWKRDNLKNIFGRFVTMASISIGTVGVFLILAKNPNFGVGLESSSDLSQVKECLPIVAPWSHSELLAAEKTSIGFFVTGHPLDDYQQVLKDLGAVCLIDLLALGSGTKARIGGTFSTI